MDWPMSSHGFQSEACRTKLFLNLGLSSLLHLGRPSFPFFLFNSRNFFVSVVEPMIQAIDASAATLAMANSTTDHVLYRKRTCDW